MENWIKNVKSPKATIDTAINTSSEILKRIPNFPECISENIVLYILRSMDVKCTRKCTGDILVGETNTQGEVKCHFNGPSQFSPSKEKWDSEGYSLDTFYSEDVKTVFLEDLLWAVSYIPIALIGRIYPLFKFSITVLIIRKTFLSEYCFCFSIILFNNFLSL